MSLNRAYSLLTVKSVDEDARVITGMATTPETDRMGDIVVPDRRARFHVRERSSKQGAVARVVVEAPGDFGTNVVIVAGEVEPGLFHALGRRDERLGREQMREVRQRLPLRIGEGKAHPVVEWIIRQGVKP